MEKKNTLLLIAAIGTTVLTVFDHFYYLGILEGDFFADFCTYTNIASNLLFGWFFLMLYSRSAKGSVLKDASIMGVVAAIFWIVSSITINYIIYHSMSSDDPDPIQTRQKLLSFWYIFLSTPGNAIFIVASLRLAIAYSRNLLISIGGWIYSVTEIIYILLFTFGLQYPLSKLIGIEYYEFDSWFMDLNKFYSYMLTLGNIASCLMLFGLLLKGEWKEKVTGPVKTPVWAYLFYYAGVIALSYAFVHWSKDWYFDNSWYKLHFGIFTALPLFAMAIVALVFGRLFVIYQQGKETVRKMTEAGVPQKRDILSNNHITFFILSVILLLIGILLLADEDHKMEEIDLIYTFGIFACSASLLLLGAIATINSKVRNYLDEDKSMNSTVICYLFGYLIIAAAIIFTLIKVIDFEGSDMAWYAFGCISAAGVPVGLSLLCAGYLFKYRDNLKALE